MCVKSKKLTLCISLKKGSKKGLETTVILTLGYCVTKARRTGTIIATSPIAESRITIICLPETDNLFFVVIKNWI